jgi:CDGSH-type Zn-finger protein
MNPAADETKKQAAAGTSSPAAVKSREELIYLLSRAAELEHGVACIYLFAAYSLKSEASEGGMSNAQAEMVRSWKRRLAHVAVEEMLHLAQVTNLITAIGGAPHFKRSNFPQPPAAFPFGIKLSLEPFSRETIERMVCYEMPEAGILSPEQDAFFAEIRARVIAESDVPTLGMPGGMAEIMAGYEPFEIDFATVGEFYHKVESGFRAIPEGELFIGPVEAQANARFLDFGGELVTVRDRDSACAAIEMIVEQGEAPTSVHPDAHFWVFDGIRAEYEQALKDAAARGERFDPVRPVVSNPMTRHYEDTSGGMVITDPRTHLVAELFNAAYETMLLMLIRFFAHTDETESELEHLSRGMLHLMTTVLRPLGEALTKMPVGPEAPGKTAGPGFGYNRDIHLLPHKRSAWVFFAERLRDLALAATELTTKHDSELPSEIAESAAALQDLAERFAPSDRTWNAAAEDAAFKAIEAREPPLIDPSLDGPLIVTNVETLINSKGEHIKARPKMSLCRCGHSGNKPFCDGTHSSVGFTSAKSPERTPDGVFDYPGQAITVHYNRLLCAASERCWRKLPEAFRYGHKPWIVPDGADTHRVVEAVRRCPSGALRYTFRGHLGPHHHHKPSIHIIENGPYEVRGIRLNTGEWNEGASRTHYTLCRCGESKNKPFCDGSHWKVEFKDEKN